MAKKKKTDTAFVVTPPDEKKKDMTDEDGVKARREKDAIDFVLDFKKESLKFYKDKFDLFNYFDRLYIKGSAKTNVPIGRANLELPLAFQQVEPFVCQMTETMAGEAPYLAYDGRGPEDEDPAKQITEYTQFQLDEGDFLQSYSQYLRNLAKYGTAIEKVCWETETEEVTEDRVVQMPVIDPATQMPVVGPDGMPVMIPQVETTTQEVKKFDGPRFYNVSIFDFFVPPSATSCDVQRLDGCVHRVWRSLSQVLSNPNYKNKEKLKRLIKSKLAEKDQVSKRMTFGADDEAKRRELEQQNSNYDEKFKGKIEVLEYWGKYCFDDAEDSDTYTLPEEALITIASFEGETVCLRVERNPLDAKFRPFIASNDYPIEGEFYGYGELHHIRGLIQESTALRNSRLDVANMSLNRMWLVERQSGLNGRELYSAPNKIVWLNDLNGIRPLDMGQVTPSSVQELGRIDYDIQNTTEIINPRQDVSNVGAAFGGTATGVNFLSAKSNLRLLLKARLQEKTFFKPLAKILLAYNRQFVTDEMYYRAYDGQQNPYSAAVGPDTFMTALDYKPSSNPSKLSNEEKKANIGYLMQTAGQIEKVAPGTNNFVALLPEMYRLAGFSHPERFVNPPQTTILMPPNGQPVDQRGAPVNVVPVDEQGQPLPPPEAGMMPTEGM